ncbi:twin-arginine translocation pathway signal protein [uncultured Roseobacter sp.]|uniref:Acg family FMN-binding oxidoreductase n=1 Tax=uncultured Roseobacter sp. TaxID=114847 RepID=UPI0026108DAF|nr:twin-arginine translocation pathway signal protein [uncultured Roseobacter sp.]
MTLTRRKTIGLIGGGVILAAGAATGTTLVRKPTEALAPWAQAGGYDDPRKRALSYALLAPNPHNRQPWLVDLSRPDEVTLYADTQRLLPETDPFNRQITIGLGCFLELMRIAALEEGLRVDIELFPEGMADAGLDTRPVARCRFAPTTAPRDPLFAQVPHRRTLKEPYDTTRAVPLAVLQRIAAAAMHGSEVQLTAAPDRVAALREISAEAFLIEFRTERTLKESVDLFRIGAREVNANPDGIDFTGPTFEMLRMAGLFTRESAMDRNSTSYKQGERMIVENMMTAMAHLWQITPDNSRAAQIRAGQDWVRINLAATAEGIGLQPLSQGLQEFPEMADIHASLHETLAPEGGTVQMWCRLGYGPQVPVSPRWPLDAKIVNA